jgi:hypothetical protein
MLKSRHVVLGVAILLALLGDSWGRSQHKPRPQNQSSPLISAQQSANQPTPPVNLLTPEQIEKSISDGVNTAVQKYETRHPSPPPDNSGWWFNLFLVVFTGGLVVVGAGQGFLTFWTLKETHTAADAALRQVNVMAAVEGPIPLVAQMKLVQYAQIPGDISVADPVPAGPIPANCRVLLCVENKGRTPLRLIELCMEKFAGTTLPPIPNYSHTSPWGLVLEKGPLWLIPPDELSYVTPADLGTAVAAYQFGGAFWVYGYFAYRNLLDERVEHKFLARWDLKEGFLPENRAGYT